MRKRDIILLLFTVLFAISCASSEQATNHEGAGDSTQVYVFDAVEPDSVETGSNEASEVVQNANEEVSNASGTIEFYIVQVGAFTSEDRAKRFIDENKTSIEQELTYHYSEKVHLYVVQLPPFRTRETAEQVRDKLWTIPAFKDSFIVPGN